MTIEFLPTLVQAGAVGISLTLIYLLYWIVKEFGVVMKNHIHDSNKVQRKMIIAITKLTEVINGLDKGDQVFVLPSQSLVDYQEKFRARVSSSFGA